MASFNKVIMMGNLTRNPELTYTPNQVACCKFGLACSRKYRTKAGEEREDVVFVDVSAWDKQAEVVNQYFSKGKPILVEGSLKLDTWEDRNTGQKRSKLYIQLQSFQFVGGPREQQGGDDDGGEAPARTRTPARTARSSAPAAAREEAVSEEQVFKDDDIPF